MPIDFTINSTNGLTFTPPERICPVCGPHTDGAVTVHIGGAEVQGEYCLRCYARWIAATFPKLQKPTETSGS